MNIINFSGGRTSAYMTKRLIDEGLTDYIVCFQNTGKEMPQTLDFINECDVRWGLDMVWLEYRKPISFEIVTYETASRNGRPFKELIEHKKGFLPNVMTRYCTSELKINTLKRYLKTLNIKDYTSFNGIRYDEPRRWGKMKDYNYDVEMPLVSWKVVKEDVLNFWGQQQFDLQLQEPYGNCDLCFLKGKNKLAKIAKEHPELFEWWINLENNYDGRLSNTFKKEISYNQILQNAKAKLELWDSDPSFDCFCNID
jgi:3'-phosphoadenosine 5'-phosphosulfate sulfotransferase (PAPS reductase)/FAD synthetase